MIYCFFFTVLTAGCFLMKAPSRSARFRHGSVLNLVISFVLLGSCSSELASHYHIISKFKLLLFIEFLELSFFLFLFGLLFEFFLMEHKETLFEEDTFIIIIHFLEVLVLLSVLLQPVSILLLKNKDLLTLPLGWLQLLQSPVPTHCQKLMFDVLLQGKQGSPSSLLPLCLSVLAMNLTC